MKKFLIIPIMLFVFAACGSSDGKSVTEELDQSWSSMTSSEQATFCLGYTVLPEREFLAQAVDQFGNDAEEAVAWAKGKCS